MRSCGHTGKLFYPKGRKPRCLACASEAVKKTRRKTKRLAIEHMGGKCNRCGYDKCDAALVFHHIDPSKKDFHLAQGGVCRSWERVKKEIEKCELVCSNCHLEIHSALP